MITRDSKKSSSIYISNGCLNNCSFCKLTFQEYPLKSVELNEVKEELEDRFGKVSEDIIIYMYEEWFEKLANSLNIKRITQTKNFIELELPEELSNNLKADKLFLESYNINSNLKFKYQNKRIKISLMLKQNDKHFLYTFVPLLELIKSEI